MATQNLPATQKADTIRALLEKPSVQKELGKIIPKHLPIDRLLRVFMTSIQQTPKLLDCTQKSLLACVMVCAELGLEPSNFLGQAYLVPFKNKGVLEAQLIPGYRGYISLARRSGQVQTVSSQVVYENDHFVLQYGLEDKLEHVPAEGDRGEPKGAYVVFRYKDGSYSFDYMPKSDIEKIRSRSRAANNGPWVTDWAEMAKKTVIKRHVKLAPLSVEFQQASSLEDLAHAGQSQMPYMSFAPPVGAIDITPPDFQSQVPEGTDRRALANFLTLCAKDNNTTVAAVEAEAAKDPGFWKMFEKYQEKPPPGDPPKTLRDEFINIKKAGYKSWVLTNAQRIRDADEATYQDALQKWHKFFPADPWPVKASVPSAPNRFEGPAVFEAAGADPKPEPEEESPPVFDVDAEAAVAETPGQPEYLNCDTEPRKGQRVSPMAVCGACKNAQGCAIYADYVDLQRGTKEPGDIPT